MPSGRQVSLLLGLMAPGWVDLTTSRWLRIRPIFIRVGDPADHDACYQSATYLLPICYHLLPSATYLLPPATARHPMGCAHLSPTGAFQFGGRFWVRSRSHPPWVALRVCRTRAQRIALGGSSCLTRRTGRTGPQTEMLPLDRGCFASGSKCPILGFGPRERAWRAYAPQCRPLGDGAP